MAVRVAINGFGRIGRCILREVVSDPEVEVVAINDLFDPPILAHLLKYDSIFGAAPFKVEVGEGELVVGGKKIRLMKETDPTKLPWGEMGVDIAMECTGKFTDREKAAAHLKAGAKKVIVSAPSKGADATLVMGVNHETFDPKRHEVVSNASCTTNCLAPLVKVIHENFGVERGFMTTIHSYTNDQEILDAPHKDFRRARAAAMSQIPTSTGAARAIGLVIPELAGKLDGFAMRVPTYDVSSVDLVVVCKKSPSVQEVNAALKKASETSLKGILGYTEEPLVSVDFIRCAYSSVVDALSTKVIGNLVNAVSWYDNEYAFSKRMIDLAKYMSKRM